MFTKVFVTLAAMIALLYSAFLQFPVVRAAESDPPPAAIENTDPVAMPMEFLNRGKNWVDAQVSWNENAFVNGYRADDAGLVTYAWALPLSGNAGGPDWNNAVRYHFAVAVPPESIQPGDALTNWRDGSYGHTLLFVQWLDSGKSLDGSKFIAQEMNRTLRRAVENVYTLHLQHGAMTVKELESSAPGPYYVVRNNQIPGYITVNGGLHLSTNRPVTGQTVNVEFSVANRGGQPISIHGLKVAVRGPNAMEKGWKAAPVDFDAALDVVLQPGEVYTYSAGHAFDQPGSYFAEPVYDADGMQSIPPSPREWFTVQAH